MNLILAYIENGEPMEAKTHAREAISIYRQLVRKRPDIYYPDLAIALQNLAKMESDDDQSAQGMPFAVEAVYIIREFAKRRPDAFRKDLASGLSILGMIYFKLQTFDTALNYSMEALRIREDLSMQSDAFLADLAESLRHVALISSQLGDHIAARKFALGATANFRKLAQTLPDKYQPALSDALIIQGKALSQLGEYNIAIDSFREAIQSIVSHEKRSDDYYSKYVEAVTSLAEHTGHLEPSATSLSIAKFVVQHLQSLAARDHSRFDSILAASVSFLVTCQKSAGEPDAATDKMSVS